MDIVKKHLTNGQYLTSEYEKLSQFLHHTIGLTAMSAWRWWNSTPDRVGTPYIIDRDGTILECFDPKLWAYHLGIRGDDNWQEKHSINIEVVSAGPLRLEGKEFIFYPLWPNKTAAKVISNDEVFEFDEPWKGHKYWHKYTEAQIDSIVWLIGRNLLEFPTLSIDNNIDDIFEYDSDVVNKHLAGLFTHNSVRKDKSDVFPYPPLIEALKGLQKEMNLVIKATKIEEVVVKSSKSSRRSRKS